MADDEAIEEADANWIVQRDGVQRITSDEPEVYGVNLFGAKLRPRPVRATCGS